MCAPCVHRVCIVCASCVHHVCIMRASCVHRVCMVCAWCAAGEGCQGMMQTARRGSALVLAQGAPCVHHARGGATLDAHRGPAGAREQGRTWLPVVTMSTSLGSKKRRFSAFTSSAGSMGALCVVGARQRQPWWWASLGWPCSLLLLVLRCMLAKLAAWGDAQHEPHTLMPPLPKNQTHTHTHTQTHRLSRAAASRYVCSEVPMKHTLRPEASAAALTLARRCRLDANCVCVCLCVCWCVCVCGGGAQRRSSRTRCDGGGGHMRPT
jgi:hypothetical protein